MLTVKIMYLITRYWKIAVVTTVVIFLFSGSYLIWNDGRQSAYDEMEDVQRQETIQGLRQDQKTREIIDEIQNMPFDGHRNLNDRLCEADPFC